MDDFIIWFFSLEMDALVGPWLKNNAITIAFILGLPYYVMKWVHGNMQKIKALKDDDIKVMGL
jgi:hypothetical protein